MVRLGRYELGRVLGEGGAGRVHEAVLHGPGGLRKEVALKVLHRGSEELRREARIGGLLRHRNLVDVYEIGEADGTWFCAMERCDGTLAGHAPLPPRAVIEVGIAVCDALQYAHEELGLVHLDLKPENLLLKDGRVKVADLGIARAEGFEHDGRIRGTRGFMAPEQLRGEPVDARADVYALGVTLLELAGTRAKPSETVSWDDTGTTARDTAAGPAATGATAQPTLVIDALEDAAPKPEGPSWTWLSAAVEPCLAFTPADRPSMAELRAVLRALDVEGPDLRTHLGLDDRTAEPVVHQSTNLGEEPDAFVGREAELGRLDRALRDPCLVTVKGPGGVGKSRLASAAARRWRATHGGQAWFCDLSEARTRDGLVGAVGRTLGVQLGRRDPVQTLGRAIARRTPIVIVLDNFEQIAALAEVVQRWRERAPEARFLVTSRVPLELPGEQLLPLEVLPETDALELLVARARARGADVTDDPDLPELVSKLDGLPLALELAAGRLGVLGVRDILERLDLRLLRRGTDDRHGTLRAALDWSWELLEPIEQAGLAQLSVFAGGFTLEAAEEILDLPEEVTALGLIDRLAHHSWLVARGARLGLLEAVRQYAAERLEDGGAAEERHGRWAMALADRWGPVGSTARIHGLERERLNLLAACRRAVARGDHEVAVATGGDCWEAMYSNGPYDEIIALSEAVCALPLEPRLEAQARRTLGGALRTAGRMEASQRAHERALDLRRRLGDREGEAQILSHLGELATARGRVDEADALYTRCMRLLETHPNARMEAIALGHLGVVHHSRGHLEEALGHYRRALVRLRQIGDRRVEGIVRGSVAAATRSLGRLEEARAHYDTALAIHRELGDRGFEGVLLGNLGVLHHELGQLDEEQACYERAIAIHRQVGNAVSEAIVLGNLADLHLARGHLEAARDGFLDALATHREVDNRRFEGWTLGRLARIDALTGDVDTAELRLARGEAALRSVKAERMRVELLGIRSEVLALAGRTEEAREALAEAEAAAPHARGDTRVALDRARALLKPTA